jgi:diacylglycerol kinase (ATP)
LANATDILVNPHARRLRQAPGLIGRIRALANGRARVHVTRSLDELAGAAAAIAERGSTRVILCGGDGTFMAGLTALDRACDGGVLPELVLAPAGTVATVARNFGHTSGVVATVERVLMGPLPAAIERPTLRVSAEGRASVTHVGFMFGTGLVARFFDRYYEGGAAGYAGAARIVARVFAGSFVADAYSRSVLDPIPCTLSVENERLPARAYSLILASVVRDVGLHLHVTYRAAEDPDRPHLVASSLSPRRLGPQAPRVFLGRGLTGDGGYDGLVREFSVAFDGSAGGPYVLDGDIFHAREVGVRAGPRISVLSF